MSPSAPARPSVAARVNAERLVVLGWGRAVLLQLAHPLIAAGVDEHSTFRTSPLDRVCRFQRTLQAMLTLTYGDEPSAQAVAAHINGIHDRVNGMLTEDTGQHLAGTPYSAHDPELLRWVHATTLESSLRCYRLFVGPLGRRDQDRYCQESLAMGPLLGIPDELLPRTRHELDQYINETIQSDLLAVGLTAQRLARDLLTASSGVSGALELPMIVPYRLITLGLLPPRIREAYGFGWTRLHQTAFDAGVRALRLGRSVMPPVLAHWRPARRSNADSACPAA